MQAPVLDALRPETTDRGARVSSLLRTILRSRKFKVLAVGSWLGYWLLCALSGGMLFYYSQDITSLLNPSQTPNPYFLNDFSSTFSSTISFSVKPARMSMRLCVSSPRL